jgi:hypothetical protein
MPGTGIPQNDHPSSPIEPRTEPGGLSRPLSYGEARALEQQRKNRATAGEAPSVVEARQGAAAVDMSMKTPRHSAWTPGRSEGPLRFRQG